MSTHLFDLYTEYLISSYGATTATGLSDLLEGKVSHDKISRMLSSERKTEKDLWRIVKPLVREIASDDGVLIIDDTIVEKPYTDENDVICWHYDHCKGRNVKGINFVTAFYRTEHGNLPIGYTLVEKTEQYIDPKSGKHHRRSPITKNAQCRMLIQHAVQNRVAFGYVIADSWYSSAETLCFIKKTLKKDAVMPLKSNRNVALSREEKLQGRYVHLDTLDYETTPVREVYLEQLDFPVVLIRQVFTNEDHSTGILYLISTDRTMTYDRMTTIYQKRWSVEVYHKSLKQNVSIAKSPTQTVTTQANHLFAALCAYAKLEMLSLSKHVNHTALKMTLYRSALRKAYEELAKLNPLKFNQAFA